VQAFLRAREINGQFGGIVHKGAEEAGALYVVVNHLDGTHDLLAPAPGAAYDDSGQRRFIRDFPAPVAWPEISERMARRRKADPDLWLIEVEDRTGLAGLSVEE
jgi:hypothetical protein